jgi:hypothetical protein
MTFQMESWADMIVLFVCAFGLPVLGLFIVYKLSQAVSPGK